MPKLIEIDGATIREIDIKTFSPADIAFANCDKMEDFRRNVDDPTDQVVGIAVVRLEELQQVAVQFFNRDGECVSYIGRTEDFVMDPPLDEEPAYDNYI